MTVKNLYEVYERMHFYLWQVNEISALVTTLKKCKDLKEFEEIPYWTYLGPFMVTLYLLVSSHFNSDKDGVVKFLEFLLEDEHVREVPQ